jgi:hypothetical protein
VNVRVLAARRGYRSLAEHPGSAQQFFVDLIRERDR